MLLLSGRFSTEMKLTQQLWELCKKHAMLGIQYHIVESISLASGLCLEPLISHFIGLDCPMQCITMRRQKFGDHEDRLGKTAFTSHIGVLSALSDD